MTHPDRAIEAGARAVTAAQMKWKAENGGDKASCVDCPDELIAAAVITAYEAHLKAEGFVVVPKEPSDKMVCAALDDYDKRGRGKQSYVNIYRAMLAAAQEQNDVPPLAGGE